MKKKTTKIMEKFTEDILFEIFMKLPIKSILACKCVCRTWCTLIRQSYFVDKHLIQSAQERYMTNLIVRCCDLNYYYFDSDDLNNLSSLDLAEKARTATTKICHHPGAAIPPFNADFSHGSSYIIGSCNGLLCVEGCRLPSDTGTRMIYEIYVCNPITRDYVFLPTTTCRSEFSRGHGFGFDAWTGQYKVVRSFLSRDYRTEICTVESSGNPSPSSWRRIENSPLSIFVGSRGVFVDGSLHWASYPNSNPAYLPRVIVSYPPVIVSLDMRDEKFRMMPWPDFIKKSSPQLLHEWRGHLAIFDYPSPNCTQIWVLKDCKGKMDWSKELRIEWCVPSDVVSYYLIPLGINKNGEILLRYRAKDLASYDIKNRRFRFLEVCEPSSHGLYWMANVVTLVSPSALK